jgi:hypothetical protein
MIGILKEQEARAKTVDVCHKLASAAHVLKMEDLERTPVKVVADQ